MTAHCRCSCQPGHACSDQRLRPQNTFSSAPSAPRLPVPTVGFEGRTRGAMVVAKGFRCGGKGLRLSRKPTRRPERHDTSVSHRASAALNRFCRACRLVAVDVGKCQDSNDLSRGVYSTRPRGWVCLCTFSTGTGVGSQRPTLPEFEAGVRDARTQTETQRPEARHRH